MCKVEKKRKEGFLGGEPPRNPAPRYRSTGEYLTIASSLQSSFEFIENAVVIVVVIFVVIETIVVVVELTGHWVTVIDFEPVGKAVVVVICVGKVPNSIIVVVITVVSRDSTNFINVENIVVVVISIDSIIHAIIVVVTAAVFTSIHYTITIQVFPIVVVVHTIVVDVEINGIRDSIVVVVVDVGIWVAVLSFLRIVDSIAVIV